FNWSMYAGDIGKMINIRMGGLAVHGGLIAGLGVALILCAIWKVRPLNLFDLAAPSIALGQAIGRRGNYFNSEAHGGPTNLPWAVTIDGATYHPTFLYESIWCFFLFILLLCIDRKRKFPGQIICLYGILYSAERFFVEALRTDSLMIGPFKQAQVISLAIALFCALLYIILKKRAGK
ncbi:MAG: prolipoprotein diacylglyceryl transferase, partial [Firmicutes bacterium]|nr:prolipoprotein diacylglyceryl transferase [Bacillota bacterium]